MSRDFFPGQPDTNHKIYRLSHQLSCTHNSKIIKVDDKFVNKGAYSW